MFKKSSKANLRRRRDTEEDETATDESFQTKVHYTTDSTSSIPSIALMKSESKPKKEKGKSKQDKKAASFSVLSFGDEEGEEETLKIKKSSRSKRIAKQIKKRTLEEKEAETSAPPTIDDNSSIVEAAQKEVHIFRAKKNDEEAAVAPTKPSFQSHFSTMSSGTIPTPSEIHAARKQREMLRKFGSEYIPVDDTQTYKENSKSRLVREDDFDGSSDEEIVEMKGIQKSKPKPLVPNQSDDEDGDHDEDQAQDEEVDRWEEEMIKKGINTQQIGAMPINQQNVGQPNYQLQNAVYNNPLFYEQQSNMVQQTPVKNDVSFNSLKKRLEDHLLSARQAHKDHQSEMDRLIYDTSECKHISEHLSDTTTLSREYQFYQEMKQYLRDLVSCLQEKVPEINSLDDMAHELWQQRSKHLTERRNQDIRDESLQCTMAGSKATDKNHQMEEEFSNRVRERQARRTRRKAQRQIQKTLASHNDGLSTDDEATSMEQAKFNTEMEKVRSSLGEVFDDVIEDFCDVQCILRRFSGWRNEHEDTYLDAYIALCIPKLLTPYVKFTLITWNPLLSSGEHFEDADWFQHVSEFGLEKVDDEGKYADDAKVIAGIVEKVVVLKLTKLVQDVWDPLSTQQTARLTVLIKQITHDYGFMSSKNRHCQGLIQGICKRIQKSLETDVYIPLLPPTSKQDMASEFLDRQTWSCIKLLKNILLFDGILSYSILCELAFDALLNRYIMLALQTAPLNAACLQKCQDIVRCIPRAWFDKFGTMKQYLGTLSRLLVHLGKVSSPSGEVMFRKEVKLLLFKIGFRDSLAELK